MDGISYVDRIEKLAENVNDNLDIDLFKEKDTDVTPPTRAFSQFLINKEQGDWAEDLMKQYTNEKSSGVALEYGRGEDKVAGEPGFDEFFRDFHEEMATIGKCPDLLVFERSPASDLARRIEDIEGTPRDELVDEVKTAVAGLEVRSSSYIVSDYMERKRQIKEEADREVQSYLEEFEAIVKRLFRKSLEDPDRLRSFVEKVRKYATAETKQDAPTFRVTSKIRRMANELSSEQANRFLELAESIRETRKQTFGRDFLSVTAKVEDFVVVLKWIQTHEVPHYYVQVFFDSIYVISFERILEILGSPEKSGRSFNFERNENNQMKYTAHISIVECEQVATDLPFPEVTAEQRTFDDGRVQNYVSFDSAEDVFERGHHSVDRYETTLSI